MGSRALRQLGPTAPTFLQTRWRARQSSGKLARPPCTVRSTGNQRAGSLGELACSAPGHSAVRAMVRRLSQWNQPVPNELHPIQEPFCICPGRCNREGIAFRKVPPRQHPIRPVLCYGATELQGSGGRARLIGFKMHRRQVADDDPPLSILRPPARREPQQEKTQDRRHGERKYKIGDWRIPPPTCDEPLGVVCQGVEACAFFLAPVVEVLPYWEGRGIDAKGHARQPG